MHRGPAGAGALNTLLQQALAPAAEGTPERRHGARVFRPGGKVIQIRNNYDKGTGVQRHRRHHHRPVGHYFDELDELQHAYAITVHRSQGSEYPVGGGGDRARRRRHGRVGRLPADRRRRCART